MMTMGKGVKDLWQMDVKKRHVKVSQSEVKLVELDVTLNSLPSMTIKMLRFDGYLWELDA